MKTILFSSPVVALVMALSSCADMGPNASSGAATGGLIGAGAGAIIGNQSGRPLEGALIGGLGGAAVGGAYGNSADQRNRQYGGY